METQSSTFQPVTKPSEPSQPQPITYASFWRRLHAYGVDSLLISILCLVIHWNIGTPALAQTPSIAPEQIEALVAAGFLPAGTSASNIASAVGAQLADTFSWSDVVLPLIVAAAYNIAFIAGGWQATPGKRLRLFNAYVINADGSKLTYQQAAYRHAASGLSTLLAGLPYLTIFFSRENRAPHDMLCDTRVVIGRKPI